MRAHPFQDGDIHLFWTHLDQLLGRAPGFKDGDDLCSLTSSPFYLIFIFLSVRRDMVLLEANEPVAYTPTDTSGCNLGRPVPGTTERYYGSLLPIVRGERAGMDQDRFSRAKLLFRKGAMN